MKDLVRTSPRYNGGNGFYWLFSDNVAPANNKDHLSIAFENVYNGTSKVVEDIDDDDSIPTHHIMPGVKVSVRAQGPILAESPAILSQLHLIVLVSP
jgi:hypothetical protein